MLRSVYAALATLLGTMYPLASYAADPCATVDQHLTHDLKIQYASLIAESLEGKVRPSKVYIDSIMRSGTWTVVYASTPVADPGYFFFDSELAREICTARISGISA